MSIVVSDDKKQAEASDLKSSLDETEELVSEDSTINYILLKDLPNKRKFLFKVGLIFCLYTGVMAGSALFCKIEQRSAKYVDRTLRLQYSMWAFLAASLLIKALFGFFGRTLKMFLEFALFLDCCFTFCTVVGVYFWMEDVQRKVYMAYGHFVLIDCLCYFVMSIIFTVSVFLKMKKTINGFLISFLIMVLVDILVIKLIETFWVTNPLFFAQIVGLVLYHSAIAIYLQLNSYLLIVARLSKFYSHENIYCFYSYYTDLFSFFWIDLFKTLKRRAKR